MEGASLWYCWVALRHRAKLRVDHGQADYFSSVMFWHSCPQRYQLPHDVVGSLLLEACKCQQVWLATYRANEVVWKCRYPVGDCMRWSSGSLLPLRIYTSLWTLSRVSYRTKWIIGKYLLITQVKIMMRSKHETHKPVTIHSEENGNFTIFTHVFSTYLFQALTRIFGLFVIGMIPLEIHWDPVMDSAGWILLCGSRLEHVPGMPQNQTYS